MRVVELQHVVAVDKNGELQQRGQKPEIGVAEDGPSEHTVGADGFQLCAQVAEGIPAEFFGGVGGWNVGDAKTGGETEQGAAQEHDSGHGFVIAIAFGKVAGGHHGADAADEGAELDDAIAPGEAALRQNFRQQAVFRGAEERGLRADQKNGGAFQLANCEAIGRRS